MKREVVKFTIYFVIGMVLVVLFVPNEIDLFFTWDGAILIIALVTVSRAVNVTVDYICETRDNIRAKKKGDGR